MAEFLLETNCLSQTDNSSNVNSMLRRIMEQNSSEAGSSSCQKLRLFLDEVSIREGLVSTFLQGFLGCLFEDLFIFYYAYLRWLYVVFYKGLNMTSACIIFPMANVYHIALGRRYLIKTYSIRLQMEDSFRT